MTISANRSWRQVPIGSVLKYLDARVSLEDTKEYRTITVKRRHGGLEERERVLGHQIKSKKQFRLVPGAFIISRVQCWHEAYAIVPDDVAPNMIASANYDQFAISPDLDPRFLWWLSHSPDFTETVRSSAFGVVIEKMVFNRAAWLQKSIPLPPLSEQRRLTGQVEGVATQIRQAHTLRKQAVSEVESLSRSILATDSNPKITPMHELVRLREPDVDVELKHTYQFAGVYCFGRGVFRSATRTGTEFAYRRLTRLTKGNFVYPKLMAWEGALGVVPEECDGCVVSTEFPVFEVNHDRVFPVVLDVYFRTPSVWPALAAVSTGTNVRRRRLNPEDFLNYQMPLPSEATQKKLATLQPQVDALKRLQQETSAELEALMPAILDKAFRGEL